MGRLYHGKLLLIEAEMTIEDPSRAFQVVIFTIKSTRYAAPADDARRLPTVVRNKTRTVTTAIAWLGGTK